MFLALREIRRSKVRFALFSGAVALLFALVMFLQTLTTSLVHQFTGALEHQSAEVLVLSDDARQNLAGSVLQPSVVGQVAAVHGVAAAGPIGEAEFTVGVRDGELDDAILVGYELGGPGEPTTLTDGRLPTGPDEAVASSSPDAGFAIGDVVTVPDGPAIEVVGVGRTLRYSVQTTLFVSYDTYEAARRAVHPDADVVLPSAVGVLAADGVDPVELAARITSEVPGVEALDRDTAVEEAPGVGEVRTSLGLVVGLGYLAVTLVIGFFFAILTAQKMRTLVLLRAVGAPVSYLVRSLLVQVVWVVAVGTLVGSVLLQVFLGGGAGDLEVDIEPGVLVATAAVILVFALAASLASVRRVAQVEPASALAGPGA